MNSVISVEGLSKRYRIGVREEKADTIGKALLQTITSPIRNFQRIRNLSRHKVDDDSIFWALRDISFDVTQGEVLGIIGNNGAGKSTLLKILSSITSPSEGEIRIRGRVASLLEVGTGFHQELTGRENVYMNGTILGMTKKEIKSKFDEIVDFSGVEQHIDTPVKFYSSGMKVRLGFAVAAHLDPEILIIDEVLAVGDVEFQKRCLGKMKDVSTSGRTILFVSHNMAAVRALCTRGIVLQQGKIECSADVSRAIEVYLNEGDNGLVLEKKWDMDLTTKDSIGLTSIEVKPVQGQVLDIDTPFRISLKLMNGLSNVNLGCTVRILNREQLIVFVAGAIISDGRNARVGIYEIDFIIPSDLLNADIYSVDVIVGQDQKFKLVEKTRVVSFEIVNTATGRGGNMNKAPGIVRPKIENTVSFSSI